jgi:hypothetical protein
MDRVKLTEWLDEMSGTEITYDDLNFIVRRVMGWVRTPPDEELNKTIASLDYPGVK